jgi:hypothetical protein
VGAKYQCPGYSVRPNRLGHTRINGQCFWSRPNETVNRKILVINYLLYLWTRLQPYSSVLTRVLLVALEHPSSLLV